MFNELARPLYGHGKMLSQFSGQEVWGESVYSRQTPISNAASGNGSEPQTHRQVNRAGADALDIADENRRQFGE